MLSTDKQTDRQTNQRYQKHNLLCQGGNERNTRVHYGLLLQMGPVNAMRKCIMTTSLKNTNLILYAHSQPIHSQF